jgi:hypothetical protein
VPAVWLVTPATKCNSYICDTITCICLYVGNKPCLLSVFKLFELGPLSCSKAEWISERMELLNIQWDSLAGESDHRKVSNYTGRQKQKKSCKHSCSSRIQVAVFEQQETEEAIDRAATAHPLRSAGSTFKADKHGTKVKNNHLTQFTMSLIGQSHDMFRLQLSHHQVFKTSTGN